MDLNERFYHDYIHERSGGCGHSVAHNACCAVLLLKSALLSSGADGDVGHDVITKAQTDRPAFDPSHYIAGALQNLAHDPGRECVVCMCESECVVWCVRVSMWCGVHTFGYTCLLYHSLTNKVKFSCNL